MWACLQFCYKEQPLWSQYRESSFGHGTLDFLNSTHALWWAPSCIMLLAAELLSFQGLTLCALCRQWHRNQDSVAVAADQTYLLR